MRLGILALAADGSFSDGTARATRVIRDLERAGLPLDGIATAVQGGFLSFDLFEIGTTTGSPRLPARRSGRPPRVRASRLSSSW